MLNPLLLAAAAFLGYRFLFPKAVTVTKGSVKLTPGIPYGFDLRQPFTAGSSDLRAPAAQSTLTKSLLAQGAQNVTYHSDSTGVLVHFVRTPTAAQTIDIGKLAYGGATVISVSRLDGKPF